jgi:heme/copper-type cytochrome/quinol oxidase subunit 1
MGNVPPDIDPDQRQRDLRTTAERERMTITDTRTEGPDAAAADAGTPSASQAVTAPPARVAGWLVSADHTRIGRLYVGVSLVAAVAVLVIGTLVMAERIDTGGTFLPSDAIDQLTTFLWLGLAFLVVVPLLLGVAIAVVPLQLGARGIAYPRAAALSFWGWFFSGVVMVAAYLANGGPGGGEADAVDVFLVSFIVLLAALAVGAACVAGTVITERAPGMDLMDVPPFAFASLVSAGALLLTLPVLAGTVALLFVDHHYARIVFGGNEGIIGEIGWSVLQPQTYVYVIPALGLAAELFPVVAGRRQPTRAVVIGALGLAGAAVIGGAMQGMPTLDFDGVTPIQGLGQLVLYGITALLPVLPFLMVLGLGGLALKSAVSSGGRPRPSGPFVFALAAVLMGLVGALVGVLTPIEDLELIGTVYQESQTYYLLFAGLLAGMGAVAYWGPKLWGRQLSDKAVGGVAVLGLLGTVLAAFPYVIAGFLDQPLGAVEWDELDGPIQACNVAVTIGFGLLALTVVAFGLLALRGFAKGDTVGDDPWDAQTLEWAVPSPARAGTVPDVGLVGSAEPLLDVKEAAATTDGGAT